MEVSTGEHLAGVCENQWIVRGAIDFNRSRVLCSRQAFTRGTVNLRHAAETIRILNSAAVEVRLADFTAVEKTCQAPGDVKLSWMRTRLVNSRIERDRRTFQCFERHRASQVGHID